LRTVFGIALSQDQGASFRWICQQAALYSETDEPEFAVTQDGTLFVGFWMGLSGSRDGGCSFSFVGGELEQKFIVDVTVRPNDSKSVLALVSEGLGAGVFRNELWESPDNGVTWAALGPNFADDLESYTLAAARSRPARIYVSAMDDISQDPTSLPQRIATIARTDDGGQNWDRFPVSGSDTTMLPYLLGVHPQDPNQVFLRLDTPEGDALLVSTDGGESFREVLRQEAKLFGFAISPDGATVLAGFGDPKDPAVFVEEASLGLWRGSSETLDFTKVFEGPIGCLEWADAGVYACTADDIHGFDLGFSTDQGSSFCGLMTLGAIDGPLECAGGCAGLWTDFCNATACMSALPPTDQCADGGTGGVAGNAGSGAASGSSGTGSGATGAGGTASGGTSGSGGSSAIAGAGGASASSADGGGCGCRMPISKPTNGAVAALVAALLAFGRRRRSGH
jgi:hypothetical protein